MQRNEERDIMKFFIFFPMALFGAVIALLLPPQEGVPSTGTTIYDFYVKTIDGNEKSLAEYKGKVLLIVNVASKCGFTPQYEGLEALYQRYKEKGFVVLGFPANNFLGQEPGSDAEIKTFCTTRYNVTFDLFSKISVKGDDSHPLYKFLTEKSAYPGAVQWNFQKYLVNKNGTVVAKFSPATKPTDPELVEMIELLLRQ